MNWENMRWDGMSSGFIGIARDKLEEEMKGAGMKSEGWNDKRWDEMESDGLG
jgi:hypothetical protein